MGVSGHDQRPAAPQSPSAVRSVANAIRSERGLLVIAVLPPGLVGLLVIAFEPPRVVGLSLLVVGIVFSGLVASALWRRLRQIARMADHTAVFIAPARVPPPPGQDVLRLGAGVAGLTEAFEAARRRADPARLEDPLTGVPNRLAATRRARDEISRARRAARPLSVALIELTFEGSDATTRQRLFRLASEIVLQTLRAYDQIGRWRDDVFVTVMPEAEIEHAVAAARRIHDRLLGDKAMQPAPVTLTVRAGVAVLQPDDATLLDIADRADRALDRARERGTGRVEAAPGPRTRPGRLVTV